MRRAIEVALASEGEGNLPIGSVIVLDGEIVGEGKSSVLKPSYHPGRHAEIMALRQVDDGLWPRAREMTCYTTLEPCVMCAGTLLLHGIGRVVFGAYDKLGGAGCTLEHLPPYYDGGGIYEWDGPLMPEVCDPLYERADAAFEDLPVGRKQWEKSEGDQGLDADELRRRLDRWRQDDGKEFKIRRVRNWIETFAGMLDDDERHEVLPYARTLFERTGYLKDFRALKRYAKRAGRAGVFDTVSGAVRENLPDIWIRRALRRGDRDAAIECWFDMEGHRRLRLCADEVVRACGVDEVELVISCRLSVVQYYVGRRARRHYRRACAELRKLRDELQRANAGEFWHYVLEDLTDEFSGRPALLDELKKAGFVE